METNRTDHDVEALRSILKALRSTPIPKRLQKQRELPGGGKKPFAPWGAYVRLLDKCAPDAWEFIPSPPSAGEVWYAERDPKNKRTITGYSKMPTISIAGTLTIRVGGASISRGSVGTVKATEAGKGLPADAAKWISFKQSCGLFGIRLERDGDYGRSDEAPRESRSQSAPAPRASRPADRPAAGSRSDRKEINVNDLIHAAREAGIPTGDLLRNSKDLFGGPLSMLKPDQIRELADEMGIQV